MAPEHRRGHGGLHDAVNNGRIDPDRLRDALAGLPLPRAADGRLVLAVDVSPWLRPGRRHLSGSLVLPRLRTRQGEHRMVPGWPYSFAAALETGGTSWTAPLDAVRLPPGADVAAVTVAQLRWVVERLIAASHWKQGDLAILVVLDAGYDAPRIAYLLDDLPVHVLGRMRPDRVLRRPTPPPIHNPLGERFPKHGGEFVFGSPTTWDTEDVLTRTDTRLCGTATAQAWNRLHPRLTRRNAWIDHTARSSRTWVGPDPAAFTRGPPTAGPG
ncbi:transposase [Actinosynnema sp. CA-299493]